MSIRVKLSNIWVNASKIWKKDNGSWVNYSESSITNYIQNNVFEYGGVIGAEHILNIGGSAEIATESCQYLALYDNNPVSQGVVWRITAGNQYATIDNTGLLTVLSGADKSHVTIACDYGGLTAVKGIIVTYVSGSSSQTESETEVVVDPETGQTTETTTTTTTTTDEQGNVTTETTTTEMITNEDGSSAYTETETTVNPDGSSSSSSTVVNYDENGTVSESTTSETTNNADGSSSSSSTTITYDENGDTTGSSTNNTNVNVDGSSHSQTVNYDADGNATTGATADTDTSGNVNTQEVEYNEDGSTTVTGYTIDTSGNPGGSEAIDDSQETGFIPFDGKTDWELTFDFTWAWKDNVGTGSTITSVLSCADFTAGAIQSGFIFRFDARKASSSVTTAKTRTSFVTERNGSQTSRYFPFITTSGGRIYTSPMRLFLTVTKVGNTLTANCRSVGDMEYNPTKDNKSSSSGYIDGYNVQSNPITWECDNSASEVDITIGGYLSSSGVIQQKADIKVHSFNVRKI